MAHPKRKKYIPYLQKMLGEDTKIVFDRKNNIWDTCRRAWLAHDMDSEYAVVIQDDAIICKQFRKRAEAVLNDDAVYCLYAGRHLRLRIESALRKNETFVRSARILNEVAICIRTEHIPEMVKFCDEMHSQTDQNITKWATKKRLPILYPIPSLVDHREGESLYRKIYNKPLPTVSSKAVIFIDSM